MAIPVTSFRQLSAAEAGGFGPALQQAMQTMGGFNQLRQQQLANRMAEQKAEINPELLQAQLGRLQQQQEKQNLPLSTYGRVQYDIQQAMDRYGEDSPIVQQMIDSRDADRRYKEQVGAHRQSKAENAPYRLAPQLVRAQIAKDLMDSGIPASKAAQMAAELHHYVPLGDDKEGHASAHLRGPQGRGQQAMGQQIDPQQMQQMQMMQQQQQMQQQPQMQQAPAQLSAYDQVLANLTPEEQQKAAIQADEVASDIVKRTTGPDQPRRAAAGARFDIVAEKQIEMLPVVSQYFGIKGQAKLRADEARALATGKVSESLQSYRVFEQNNEVLVGEGALMMSIPADKESRQGFASIFKPARMATNPAAAQKQYADIVNMVRSTDAVNSATLSQLMRGDIQPREDQLGLGAAAQEAPQEAPQFQALDQAASQDDFMLMFNQLSPQERVEYRQSRGMG